MTRRQSGILIVIALVIGAALVLLLLGVPWAVPATPGSKSEGDPFRVELTGTGRATVVLTRDGVPDQPVEMELPGSIAIDRDTEAVEAEARPAGRDDGAEVACAIIGADGEILDEARAPAGGGVVRCQAVLP